MKSLLLSLLLSSATFGGIALWPTLKTAEIADGAFKGVVTDQNNQPIQNAEVRILEDRKLVESVKTNEKGQFSINLKPGVIYQIEFSAKGHETKRIVNVKLGDSDFTDMAISLQTSVLEETVVQDWNGGATGGGEPARYATTALRSAPDRSEHRKVAYDKSTRREAPAATPPPPPALEPARDMAPATDDVSFEVPLTEGVSIRSDRTKGPEESESLADKITPGKPTPGAPTPRAGLLTAGEWNDLDNWARHWIDLLADGEINDHQTTWKIWPKQRYTLLLQNEDGMPIVDAAVQMRDNDKNIIWEARTDNTGKAELWYQFFGPQSGGKPDDLIVTVDGKIKNLGEPIPYEKGINIHQIKRECKVPNQVNLVWAVDATGSMGDEIEYLKTELLDVIGRVKSMHGDRNFKMGTVFYRDQGDEYLVKSSGLSPDISLTVDYIRKQYAGGGGDMPEAVHSALDEAIFNQKWSENAVARICFLVLDASPHQRPEVLESLQKTIREAARRGIRIVPLSASGIQKDTEFLMKFMGLATNGTYLFLTDHSGIGGKHTEPTTDEYKVEMLNDLLVRLIGQYVGVESCEGKSSIRFEPDGQQQQQETGPSALFYPNPASVQFTLELPFAAEKVTLYDAEGKAALSWSDMAAGTHTVGVRELPAGFYTLRIWKGKQVQSGKLMVIKS